MYMSMATVTSCSNDSDGDNDTLQHVRCQVSDSDCYCCMSVDGLWLHCLCACALCIGATLVIMTKYDLVCTYVDECIMTCVATVNCKSLEFVFFFYDAIYT